MFCTVLTFFFPEDVNQFTSLIQMSCEYQCFINQCNYFHITF